MGTNSIKSNLTKEDVISEIKLSLGSGNRGVIIIVEGNDDIRFLKSIVNSDVEILESFSGKHGVKEIIEFFPKNKQIIGICDKDYELASSLSRIFFYDYCCLEVMLIMSDEAFESVYSEYYQGDVLQYDELRKKCFNDLKWISLFRKLNDKNNWKIRFSGFSFPNAYEKGFHIGKAVICLNKLNPTLLTEFKKILGVLTKEYNNELTLVELAEITQGHDFLNYFHCLCTEDMPRGKQPSVDQIASSLRCAYRASDFNKTSLYKQLRKYEQDNRLIIINSNYDKKYTDST